MKTTCQLQRNRSPRRKTVLLLELPEHAVVTPDECVAIGERERSLNLHSLMGGLAPELGRQSLQLVEKKVLPRLRASGALREAGRRARPA